MIQGGEYNVARGLRRAFGLRSAVVTGLVRNEVGLLLEDLILQGGVDPEVDPLAGDASGPSDGSDGAGPTAGRASADPSVGADPA